MLSSGGQVIDQGQSDAPLVPKKVCFQDHTVFIIRQERQCIRDNKLKQITPKKHFQHGKIQFQSSVFISCWKVDNFAVTLMIKKVIAFVTKRNLIIQ